MNAISNDDGDDDDDRKHSISAAKLSAACRDEGNEEKRECYEMDSREYPRSSVSITR